jgi:hypothetical protein
VVYFSFLFIHPSYFFRLSSYFHDSPDRGIRIAADEKKEGSNGALLRLELLVYGVKVKF